MLGRMFRSAAPRAADDRVRMVAPQTVRQWLAAGEAVVVDVREPAEYAAEHIAGSVLNPLSGFDATRLPELGGRKLVLHCRSGARCGMAAERLLQAGYGGAIHRMDGGLIAWKAAGGAVVAGP